MGTARDIHLVNGVEKMRFEQPVSNVAARFPELRVHVNAPTVARSFGEEIADGVARGRRLHGRYWRQVVRASIIRPVAAFVGHAVRLATRSVSGFKKESARRQTIRELRALSDHVLRDIGIERSHIPLIATALVYDDPRAGSAAAASPAADVAQATFERARAA